MKLCHLAFALLIPLTSMARPFTVSGISSGGYMAQQLHTAFSSEIEGVGIVAAGPYWCAKGKLADALYRCMSTHMGQPNVKDIIREARRLEKAGLIDSLENLKFSKVYSISGTLDQTISQKVSDIIIETYLKWGIPEQNILYENKIELGHAFPTENFGNPCTTTSQTPFISNCGRDVAGEILNHLIGPLKPKVQARVHHLMKFDQMQGLSDSEFTKASLNKTGYAYIPEGCNQPNLNQCKVHVAFHGCKQTVEDINDLFITKTGYNEWAEANQIVIIYPQALKNPLINNPNGCWDWWGFTGSSYHHKNGLQMRIIANLVRSIQRGLLKLENSEGIMLSSDSLH